MVRKNKDWDRRIILLSAIGLVICTAVLFPQVRNLILNYLAEHVIHKDTSINHVWNSLLFKFALIGIFAILFLDYCIFANSGKSLIHKLRKEINDCLSKIDFRSFLKPSLILLVVYLLGIFTIIRANFSYKDDVWRAAEGSRQWFSWSRYVSEFLSIFIHGDTRLTDISPIPQLLAILILAVSSVLLVYVLTGKITVTRLLASIPLGLSPYFLECLSYKFDSPYTALSVLASIFPFLFSARKKVFLLVSIVSLLIMCMTYQPAAGIYMLIVVVLCFQNWNRREKTNKEILSFLGIAVFAFCFTLLVFRFFLMKPVTHDASYAQTSMLPASQLITGILNNIKDYALTINHDFGMIWKIGILLALLFFITKSVSCSAQRKVISFFLVFTVIVISFLLSYGVYSLLQKPLYAPRALLGFGVFLAVICIYAVSDFKKISTIVVLALNWCLFTFAFSYGNALADQARYAEFRIGILTHDLSALYPDVSKDSMSIQIENSIDFAPSIKNIAKHNPVIERLVPSRLSDSKLDYIYFLTYFNDDRFHANNEEAKEQKNIDFSALNLPVVLDSYYHTIQSDGNHIIIVLKH